jgi:hypothetical protein
MTGVKKKGGTMTWVRRFTTAVLACLAAACGAAEAVAPAIQYPTKPPVETQPPIAGARTFVFDSELEYPVRGYTTASSFVLYDNGAFGLRYGADIVYRGIYKESAGVIEFSWEGSSTAGSWGATGTIAGDILTVRYNLIMMMTDFEDARYKLLR